MGGLLQFTLFCFKWDVSRVFAACLPASWMIIITVVGERVGE